MAADADLTLTYFQSESRAEQLKQIAGKGATIIKADVRHRNDVQKTLNTAIKGRPRVDFLVNMAGLSFGRNLSAVTYADWRTTVDTNAYSVLIVGQVIGSYMKCNGGGAIVNISSVASRRPLPLGHEYMASKAAIEGLTRSLALALAPEVVVNTVAPGWVNTDRKPRSVAREGDVLSRIPLRRFATADDIVDVVLLLSKKESYVTGQTIVVDGGYTI